MSGRIIRINFPTRLKQMEEVIEELSKDKVKMLLCYGVSLCKRRNAYVCDCGKSNCRNAGKHPIGNEFPKGEHSATGDTGRLKKILVKNPNANLAIIINGFFVIDVDGPEGMDFVRSLDLPRTLRVKTGRGYHYYYRGVFPGKPKALKQIDIKTKGYVMFEPSRHKSGVCYRRMQ